MSTKVKSARAEARIYPEERQALLQVANAEMLSMSDALRLAIREAAKSRGLWPPLPHSPASRSRLGDTRSDGRTPDGRSQGSEK
jgi:hypothetical protein